MSPTTQYRCELDSSSSSMRDRSTEKEDRSVKYNNSSIIDRRKSVQILDKNPVILKNSSDIPSSTKCSTLKSKNTKKRSWWLILLSAYINLPIIVLVAGIVKYYGGVNEAMIAVMSQGYYNYGLLHGYENVLVNTEYGQLRGFTSYSREGRKFFEFLGIPYATPPVGKLRFQAPIPPIGWEGVRDATGYGPACTQYDLFLQAVMGEEDCLTLNIHTNKLNSTDGKLLPVLFFIHGGMYHFGRAMDFGGDHFMDFEAVVVTINYRLQAFGFLNTGDGYVSGNMGLKDQVAALRWVQRNIHHFSGDPNLVTIWGESAGGASTQLHALSPMSKGLFHRAISNSGFSLAHWSFIRTPGKQAKIFAKALGCPTNQASHEMVECLKKVSSYRIAELFRGNHDVLHPRLDVFAPTIESGSHQDEETFLSAHPRDLLRQGKIISKVPMINGANSHEGLIYAGYFVRNESISKSLNEEWHKHSPVLLDFEDLDNQARHQVSSQIWDFYLGKNKTIGLDSLHEIVSLFSDASFFKPMEESAFELAKSGVPLYLYQYNHHGEFGVAQGYFRLSMKLPLALDGLLGTGIQMFNKHVFGIKEKHWGVCHADEMAIFFKMHSVLSRILPGHEEYQFSKEMVKTWVYFAKHGKPPLFQGHHWTPIQHGQPLKYMKLDSKKSPGMVLAPWSKRLKFLSSLLGFQCIQQYFNKNGTDKPSICF